MHVALIADSERLRRERAWYNRTVVGLLTSGVRVTRLLPDGEPDDPRVALAPAVWYRAPRLPWMHRWALAPVVESLAHAPPDVIHATGRQAWELALEVAEGVDAQVALDVWSDDEVVPAARCAENGRVAAVLPATHALARSLERRLDPGLVQTVPIGVHLPREPRRILDNAAHGITVIVSGRGVGVEHLPPLLEGLARCADTYPQLMAFADFEDQVDVQAWRTSGRLDLHRQLSLIPSFDEHRNYALGADLFIVPRATGGVSSLTLQLMGEGVATIAVRDRAFLTGRGDNGLFDPQIVGPVNGLTGDRLGPGRPVAADQNAG